MKGLHFSKEFDHDFSLKEACTHYGIVVHSSPEVYDLTLLFYFL